MKYEINKSDIYRNVESKEFSIGEDEESRAIQFKLVFENLYSNPLRATIREIASNAIDANSKTGRKRKKIRVTFPTSVEPTLWIHDNGPGITPDMMESVYTKVFTSTKRDSNNQIGAYGIGRLSCLSLAEQFPLVTVADGVEYHYAIFLNERGIPDSALLASNQTDKSNGTSVGIPIDPQKDIKDTEEIERYLIESLVYSDNDIVTDNENLQFFIDNIKDTVYYETNSLTYYRSTENLEIPNQDFLSVKFPIAIRIGGILYTNPFNNYSRSYLCKVDTDPVIYFIESVGKKFPPKVVIDVPIGDLELNTSREEIIDNEKNRNTLFSLLEEKGKELFDLLTNEVKSYSTSKELFHAIDKDYALSRFIDIFDNYSLIYCTFVYSFFRKKDYKLPKEKIYLPLEFKSSIEGRIYRFQAKDNNTYETNRVTGSNTISTVELLKGNLILHKSSKKQKASFYSKRAHVDSNTILFVSEDINESDTNYTGVNLLKDLGVSVEIVESEPYSFKKEVSNKTKSNNIDLGKYIRPKVNSIPRKASKWTDLFVKEPLGYLPEKGLYVINSDNLRRVCDFMSLCTEEEASEVFFIRDSVTHLLPNSFQHFQKFLKDRAENRPSIINKFLWLNYHTFSFKYMESRFKKLADISNDLTEDGRYFLENLSDIHYKYIQELCETDYGTAAIKSFYPDYNRSTSISDLDRIRTKEKDIFCEDEFVRYLFGSNKTKYKALCNMVFYCKDLEYLNYLQFK